MSDPPSSLTHSRFLTTARGGTKFEDDQNFGRKGVASFSITTALGRNVSVRFARESGSSNRFASREKIIGESWNFCLCLRAGYMVFLFDSFQSSYVYSFIFSSVC